MCTCGGFGQWHPVARLVHPNIADLCHCAVLLVLWCVCLTQHPHLPQHITFLTNAPLDWALFLLCITMV